jgi:hypothetical protein
MNASSPASPSRALSSPVVAAGLALVFFVGALLGFGAALDGFSHAVQPVALLGARGVPGWWAFDALGFVIPGLLAWWAMVVGGRAQEHASGEFGLVSRIGWTLCTLAALAFALQGWLPVDATKGLGYGVGRLHVAAWTVWWIAFFAGALCLVLGAGTHANLRRTRIATAVAAIVVLVFALLYAVPGAPALGQRIAFVAWFAWMAWMARVSSR